MTMVVRKKRVKRKRRGHYHTGVHTSSKTGRDCKYRSGWELLYMRWLDINDDVVDFGYECVKIPYVSNSRTRKVRHYFPDFLVQFRDGRKVLVEIKPSKRLDQVKVKKKLAAAQEWCGAHGCSLQIITENELKLMGLL